MTHGAYAMNLKYTGNSPFIHNTPQDRIMRMLLENGAERFAAEFATINATDLIPKKKK